MEFWLSSLASFATCLDALRWHVYEGQNYILAMVLVKTPMVLKTPKFNMPICSQGLSRLQTL